MEEPGFKYTSIGRTRDDAAGEAFDKCGKLLGLKYPAGATISRLGKDKNRKFYEEFFIENCTRLAALQCADGYWHASLLDPESYPSPETSATGLITYALAYGINAGLLDKTKFLPVVIKGWQGMLKAVDPSGKLGYVQPIGADPRKVTRDMTEVYGVGAFLLAGCQIYQMGK